MAVNENGAWRLASGGRRESYAKVLRVSVQQDAGTAQAYYRQGEYYADGLELPGEWRGEGAARLGLVGEVTKRDFASLCENRDPVTEQPLTARTKTHRRVLFDINLHVPKSVSLLHGLFGDEAILTAFRQAVDTTITALEADLRTRVRRGGRDETRKTGNGVVARFIHTTARPVNGIPDPHLHAHCCVFNATWDETEQTWKAIELSEVYASLPFFEMLFHSQLAKSIRELGYDVDRTRTGWEIAGIPRRVLQLFSQRTAMIEAKAEELGITDAHEKDRLGAQTRQEKRRDLSLVELRNIWRDRFSADEWAALTAVNNREVRIGSEPSVTAREALAWAIEHVFERESVVPIRKLLTAALRHAVGSVSVRELLTELSHLDLIRNERDGQELVTTRTVLDEESRMLTFARAGRGRCLPFGMVDDLSARELLSDEQVKVARYVLASPDRVVLIRGAAGTGKTTLMRATIAAIEARGHRVLTLAPSADASRGVLRGEGFLTADTVARFLANTELQESVRGQVIWVDEAGLLGTRSLAQLFQLAASLEVRVVLSGDVRQHGPVDRGLPLRLLETDAGLVSAEMKTIRRQQGHYREAVKHLSEGRTLDGFDVLTELGWVREVEEGARLQQLAEEYHANRSAGKSTLVVVPTHAEGRAVTQSIRSLLQSRGELDIEERVFTRLDAKPLTVAERQVATNYDVGDAIVFHQRAPGFVISTRYRVVVAGHSSVAVADSTGRIAVLPLKYAERLTVYSTHELSLAKGDRMRITKNGRSSDRSQRVNNGQLETVLSFTPSDDIQLASGVVLSKDFGHLAHGYAITSHASQGKTVDRVLLAVSSASFGAVGQQQFYVSASRGREQVTVFTDDAMALRRAIQRNDPKLSATELVRDAQPSLTLWRAWLNRRLEAIRRLSNDTRSVIERLTGRYAVNRDVIERGRG